MVRVVEREAALGDAASVLATIDRFCYQRHWMMHVGDVKGELLRCAARRAAHGAAALCVEIGAYCGYSAVLLASSMRPCDRVVSLESEAECVEFSRRVLRAAGFAEDRARVVHVRAGESPAAALRRALASECADSPATVRLLFVDHAKERYLPDLLDFEPLLEKGAIVVADNILSFDGGASLEPYLARVRDPTLYTESVLHTSSLEYSKGSEPDGVEISVFR